MIEIQNPYKKEALIKTLENTYAELEHYFESLTVDVFFKKTADKWSPSENLIHLTKSAKAFTMGLRFPKMIIGLKFGKAARNSRLYPQVREAYLNRLVEGAKSPKNFEPDEMKPDMDLQSQKDEILKKWHDTNNKLIRKMNKWEEKTLDLYLLPHPILGRVTVREMIMFTIYHYIHHFTNVQKSLSE